MKARIAERMVYAWLALALPLIAVKLWVLLGVGYYRPDQFAGDAIVLLAWCALLVLAARGRVLGVFTWAVTWLLYLLALMLTLAEALSFYFQASSFNGRFFANVRLDNLQSGILAFPVLAAVTVFVLLTMLAVSAWLLARQVRLRARDDPRHGIVKGVALVAALVIACALPSSAHRLGHFLVSWDHSEKLVFTGAGRAVAAQLDKDPPLRDRVYANPGKNLVIVYMESLERIYTDDRIFPGLTPNLDRWRAKGLDFSGYLTFPGADYTIAGIFASQCGVPYLPSPVRALDLGGNDANVAGFQPTLACLGDILDAAGYEQVFMQGANLSFADKGAFFHLHGFDHVLGLEELEKRNDGKLPSQGWGLYDSDLLRLAVKKFDTLAASGKPFNLEVLTVDDHPQQGRPSPGCPEYAVSDNSMLQAVHCTDYLVGRFLDTISRNPAWKDTIVVVMSDHLSLPNDAWPLFPERHERRPLLFILNAGQGRRDMRFYHMDIAPTVLNLMGVKTNARFIAGADRSAADAPDSPLLDDDTDLAVLRRVLWARAQPVELCKRGELIGPAPGGFKIGGIRVPLTWKGRHQVALRSDQAWIARIGERNVHGAILDRSGVSKALSRSTGGESALLIQPLAGQDPSRQFSIDWVGKNGARARLGVASRLSGLQVGSSQCASLLEKVDAAPPGTSLDLSGQFKVRAAPNYPDLPQGVDFDQHAIGIDFAKDSALPFERGFGWLSPEVWGSFSAGSDATLGFTLPEEHCHAAQVRFKVHPFVHTSRPTLVVRVTANGALMTTWRFHEDPGHGTWYEVEAPIRTPDAQCRVDLRFDFSRPGASPPPYPEDEDPRPLQLLFLSMKIVPAPATLAKGVN